MARERHLKNAPIREAIIDIRIAPQVALEGLVSYAEGLRNDFPEQEELRQSTLGIEFGQNQMKASRVDNAPHGVRLVSKDSKYIVQLRCDGFTFSCLPPYESWQTIERQARSLWNGYVAKSQAEKVTRVAVRYINVIELPLPTGELKDYLSAPPEIPENLPQELSGFFSRIVIVNKQIDANALVTLALEPFSENRVLIILDIDVFRENKEASLAADGPYVWDIVNQLKKFEDQVFFQSLTEKTVEMFE